MSESSDAPQMQVYPNYPQVWHVLKPPRLTGAVLRLGPENFLSSASLRMLLPIFKYLEVVFWFPQYIVAGEGGWLKQLFWVPLRRCMAAAGLRRGLNLTRVELWALNTVRLRKPSGPDYSATPVGFGGEGKSVGLITHCHLNPWGFQEQNLCG